MGRERNRTRKYVHLSIVGMIFISLIGCALLKEIRAKREASESLVAAQKLLDQGDFAGSLKENQKVLSLYDTVPPGDEALFNTGLIYVHYGYSERDYKRSLDLFRRLVKVFPQSLLAAQAKIWIEILLENETLNRETEESNKSIKKSQQENERLKKEIEELNRAIREPKQENERLKKEIEELNKTIRESKQVDIEVDEKKKKLSK